MHNFEELVLSGEYKEAESVSNGLREDEIVQKIMYIACKTKNLTTYGFIIYKLLFNEKAVWHYLAAELFLAPLCYIDGAYALGVFHARSAIELEPQNIEHKKMLLAFYVLPEPAISKEEAYQLAKEIIKVDSNAEAAIWILEKLESKH